ncbi:MAG: hypothetical protein MMC33_007517 [Icmadophila ericetorum]|nr:hypothetical protein [Icmadophila ericetorum]
MEVKTQYELLSQQVHSWIEEEVSHYQKQLLKDFEDEFSDTAEWATAYKIFKHLFDHVLGDHVPQLGLSADQANLLLSLEHGMHELEPRRDAATIYLWRSETRKALATTPEAIEETQRKILDISAGLFRVLISTSSFIGNQESSFQRLRDLIVSPAAELASSIKLSPTQFCVGQKLHIDSLERYEPARLELCGKYKMIDVSTRKVLKASSSIYVNENGFIGRVIVLLEPSLKRIDSVSQKSLTLRPATMLVVLKRPLGQSHRFGIDGEDNTSRSNEDRSYHEKLVGLMKDFDAVFRLTS